MSSGFTRTKLILPISCARMQTQTWWVQTMSRVRSCVLCSLKPCSACLRTYKITMTTLPQVAGKRNLSKSVNSTESALAGKIRKTQETKARLEKTILDVDLEIQNLTRTSAKLTKLLGRRKASLQTAEKRMQVLEHPHISTWTCSC